MNFFGTDIGNYFLTLLKLTTYSKKPPALTNLSDVRFLSLAWLDCS